MDLILIDDYSIKNIIISKLYNLINVANFRYKLLKANDLLEQIKNEDYYISCNTKGVNFFLIFFTLNDTNCVYLINRKFLSYNKNNIDNTSRFCLDLILFPYQFEVLLYWISDFSGQ